MFPARVRKLVFLLSAATVTAVGAGGCLPQNFYADLAGNALSSAVLALVDAFLQQFLTASA